MKQERGHFRVQGAASPSLQAPQTPALQSYRAQLRACPRCDREQDTLGLPSGSLASSWDSQTSMGTDAYYLNVKLHLELLGGGREGEVTVLGAQLLGCRTSRHSLPHPPLPSRQRCLRRCSLFPTFRHVLAHVHLPGPSVAISSHALESRTCTERPVFPALAFPVVAGCLETGTKPLWVLCSPWLRE